MTKLNSFSLSIVFGVLFFFNVFNANANTVPIVTATGGGWLCSNTAAAGWNNTGFTPTGWVAPIIPTNGANPDGTCSAGQQTMLPGVPKIWMPQAGNTCFYRFAFNLDGLITPAFNLNVIGDDFVTVFLNGVQIGPTTANWTVNLAINLNTPNIANNLRCGQNVLAFRVNNTVNPNGVCHYLGVQGSVTGEGLGTHSISGPSNFCTSATYSVPNLPIGSVVSWSISPSAAATLVISGHSVTINKLQDNVIITLTANITNRCSNKSIAKVISIGKPPVYSIEGFPFNGINFAQNSEYDFWISPPVGTIGYQWSVAGGTILSGQGTNFITVMTSSTTPTVNKYFDVSVRVQNSCGWSSYFWRSGYIKYGIIDPQLVIATPSNAIIPINNESRNTSGISSGNNSTNANISGGFTLYPNPTASALSLSFQQNIGGKVQAEIYNISGQKMQVVTPDDSYSNGKNTMDLDVSSLPVGMYICRFKDSEGNYSTQKFVKE